MPVVLDASAVVGLALDGQASDAAQRMLDHTVAHGGVVPTLFWYELRNALLMAERRGRITPDGVAAFLADVALLPIAVDDLPRDAVVLQLARQHGLTVYDATSLELAMRIGAPLATLDAALRVAAERARGGDGRIARARRRKSAATPGVSYLRQRRGAVVGRDSGFHRLRWRGALGVRHRCEVGGPNGSPWSLPPRISISSLGPRVRRHVV
jgi:predicted nucleic acid-binding protein